MVVALASCSAPAPVPEVPRQSETMASPPTVCDPIHKAIMDAYGGIIDCAERHCPKGIIVDGELSESCSALCGAESAERFSAQFADVRRCRAVFVTPKERTALQFALCKSSSEAVAHFVLPLTTCQSAPRSSAALPDSMLDDCVNQKQLLTDAVLVALEECRGIVSKVSLCTLVDNTIRAGQVGERAQRLKSVYNSTCLTK